MYKFRSGFTLAETMIAVAIVGVIAVLTIPSFVKGYNQRANFTKLLKMHHDLEQNLEILRTQNIYGDYLNSSLYTDNETKLKDFFNKNYKVKSTVSSDECSSEFDFSCDYAVRLKDNSVIAIKKIGSGSATNSYSSVYIDVNGYEPPNQNCEDRYQFNIYKKYEIDVINPYSTSYTPNLRVANTLQERLRCVGEYINNGWKRE